MADELPADVTSGRGTVDDEPEQDVIAGWSGTLGVEGVPLDKYDAHPLEIDAVDDLHRHEAEIVRRISEVQHGGNLFVANPLRFLQDVEVVLSQKAQEELLAAHPNLAMADNLGYDALRGSPHPQTVRIKVSGLFGKSRPKNDEPATPPPAVTP